MITKTLSLEQLWREVGFAPNANQHEAILHVDGPLYLPAGPGSGKTRVLLWRTLNLCVFHGVHPEEIYLSTFTEKAAYQLKEGLRSLFGLVTNHTGVPYDLSKMYIGTVHSLCQRLIADRRFYPQRRRIAMPSLLDELAQYFYVYKNSMWAELIRVSRLEDQANLIINSLFNSNGSRSKYVAVTNSIMLFNRLSEECIDPEVAIQQTSEPVLQAMLAMYATYKQSLNARSSANLTDFSLLQQRALLVLEGYEDASGIFKHVIIDEYQDTNTIQERLFFRLATGHTNICAVGDDDQALYRFRGATVENFVQFPERCQLYLGTEPRRIPLSTNYRSRVDIVRFYTDFMERCDWERSGYSSGSYRVTGKNIHAQSTDQQTAIIATTAYAPDIACAEIAQLVRQLIDTKKVENANQIAFLFPSLKYRGVMNVHVRRMKDALEREGFRVYAPRAGRFLEVDEATALFGIFMHIFGRPPHGDYSSIDYDQFHSWIDRAYDLASTLMDADPQLARYVKDREDEINTAVTDYKSLLEIVTHHAWDQNAPYSISTMEPLLSTAPRLSDSAKKALTSAYFKKLVQARLEQGRPFSLDYILKRATSLDWSVLDLFYRICGFNHFRQMFELAERGEDEGPICNLGLLSQYLARFMDQYTPILTADYFVEDRFQHLFFLSYLFALFRRGESEYEDAEDPFPKGRVPFLTIHQSKGLEFPVVVLGNLRKDNRGPQKIETLVQPLVHREGEPLDKMTEFDTMRMFYVALSRAKNLVVLAHFKGQGNRINEPFRTLLDDRFPRIPNFDLDTVPVATLDNDAPPRNYSYTSDYLLYQKCPRQYMIFRKYGFVPSRSQTMMFGSLVHRTMDDLHQYLIAKRMHP
jgi:DNA helicase-2/ATP-dependent DNA helicase PcrA